MKQLAIMLAAAGTCVMSIPATVTPAAATETYEAQMQATDAADQARADMLDAFGPSN